MKPFSGVSYITAVNQLQSIAVYRDCNYFVDNVDIQSIFTRIKYQEILLKLHFADNTKQDKADKRYMIRPMIDHLNESLQAVFSNKPDQSIDEHMTNSNVVPQWVNIWK